ncbi:aspartate/glutamate racemase family protein [Actibacterium lipolyticum]|uniref:Asp/Glu/Hydantoin racemase n=1 Tax=Actibacterium lipolyticum TaxID=1524263 RepID=A0A238JVD5_9RHOB|nr:aspartate/glutamate racemase family protein [Actibacterium lipolyticum]SMX34611.1 Asp/Glu/Hydantoin racemase [Actibacterium lipolyticum]
MRILFMNPNATQAMTDSILGVARAASPSGVEVEGWTNLDGPPAIEGPADGDAAVVGLLAGLSSAQAQRADAVVIACFDDTGLEQMRDKADCPVIGIGQASYAMAGLLGHRFSVVTSLPVSIPVIKENILALGHASRCASVRASGLPVLTIEEGGEQTRARLADEVSQAHQADGATAVILGCAGMAALYDDLKSRADVVLIEGIRASVCLSTSMLNYQAS